MGVNENLEGWEAPETPQQIKHWIFQKNVMNMNFSVELSVANLDLNLADCLIGSVLTKACFPIYTTSPTSLLLLVS